MRKSDIIRRNRISRIKRHARINILRAENPALDALFVQLRKGKAPNVLEMMSALSEVSTLFSDADSASCVPHPDENRCLSGYLDPASEQRCQNC